MLASLGLNLLKQQKYAEAEPLLRECLTIREQNEPDDWTTFNTKSMLGGSLLGQKKYAEAEPLLLAGYEGMKQREEKIPPQGKVRLTEAIERLVQLYEATGKTDKAAEWRKKLPATKSAEPAETKKRLKPVSQESIRKRPGDPSRQAKQLTRGPPSAPDDRCARRDSLSPRPRKGAFS